MSQYIKNLIGTRGWKEVEDIFDSEIRKMDNSSINESLPSREYKIVSLANKKAAESIRTIIKRVRLQGGNLVKEVKTFK